MRKYICSGFKSVIASDMTEAAEVFAARHARRAYGRRGYARTCVQGSYARDFSFAEWSAFIGYSSGRNETTGHNVHFTVHQAELEDGAHCTNCGGSHPVGQLKPCMTDVDRVNLID